MSARRRDHSFFIGLALAILAMALTLFVASFGARPVVAQESEGLPNGEQLFTTSCASCHGPQGGGTEFGPPLTDVGEAAADFQLRTGRMPLADPDAQTMRKPPAFSPEEIDALVAYVGTIGEGPEIPEGSLVGGDLSSGQALFVENCAACHGAIANGGAAGPGALAPSLYRAGPLDIAEAMITGPGEMPRFNLDADERNDIIAFISHLQTQDAPGGADIGGIGPVPEGFVAWALGVPALVAACWLLGRKRPAKS